MEVTDKGTHENLEVPENRPELTDGQRAFIIASQKVVKERQDKSERLKMIAEAVSGMPYSEWCKIRHAIEQKFSWETSKVTLGSSEEVLRALEREI